MSLNAGRVSRIYLRVSIAAICAAGALYTVQASANTDAAAAPESSLDEVIVTGSRETGLKASDSPGPDPDRERRDAEELRAPPTSCPR